MRNYKAFLLLCMMLLLQHKNVFSQKDSAVQKPIYKWAIKTNLFSIAMGQAGASFEKSISKNRSIELTGGYNYWRLIYLSDFSIYNLPKATNVNGLYTQLGYRFYYRPSDKHKRMYSQINFVFETFHTENLEKRWLKRPPSNEAICSTCVVVQNYKTKEFGLNYTHGFAFAKKNRLLSEFFISFGYKYKIIDLNVLFVETYDPLNLYIFNNDYKLRFYKGSPVFKLGFVMGGTGK